MDGKSITIRDCAVDSGSLTADTEIIRLQNALGPLEFLYPLGLLLIPDVTKSLSERTGYPTVVPSTLGPSMERSMFEAVS